MNRIGLEIFKEFSRWKELPLYIMDFKKLPGIKTHYIALGSVLHNKTNMKLYKIT